jgi:hypothetical protein
MHYRLLLAAGLVIGTQGAKFPFETIQLSKEDVTAFPAVEFGDAAKPGTTYDTTACKAFPGTPQWPAEEEWSRLNTTVGGALLKPIPEAAACYDGPHKNAARCSWLLTEAADVGFYVSDPLSVLTEWSQGGTCRYVENPNGTCTQGGFPVYVVNVTSVKQVQAAVNFARNKNVRLVVK